MMTSEDRQAREALWRLGEHQRLCMACLGDMMVWRSDTFLRCQYSPHAWRSPNRVPVACGNRGFVCPACWPSLQGALDVLCFEHAPAPTLKAT